MIKLTPADVLLRAAKLAKTIPGSLCTMYPIPRGGIPVAFALASVSADFILVDSPEEADFFIDDIEDSGETKKKWMAAYPNTPFYSLVSKAEPGYDDWIVFPWEGESESGIEDHIRRLIQYVGEDSNRGGLLETPKRVAKAWQHWCSGYAKDPKKILKVFEDGASGCDEMIIVKDIPFYSQCEHHLAPFFGTVTIGYIPNGKIVGLSKLSRLVDIFSRRLQVQERLTNQIADSLVECLEPLAVGVVLNARHLCMESRGICQQGHSTTTSALRGAIKNNAAARAEFLSLTKI